MCTLQYSDYLSFYGTLGMGAITPIAPMLFMPMFQEEMKIRVKFASICRKSGKMAMSETTLLSPLKKYPRVGGYPKHHSSHFRIVWLCLSKVSK